MKCVTVHSLKSNVQSISVHATFNNARHNYVSHKLSICVMKLGGTYKLVTQNVVNNVFTNNAKATRNNV